MTVENFQLFLTYGRDANLAGTSVNGGVCGTLALVERVLGLLVACRKECQKCKMTPRTRQYKVEVHYFLVKRVAFPGFLCKQVTFATDTVASRQNLAKFSPFNFCLILSKKPMMIVACCLKKVKKIVQVMRDLCRLCF